MLLLMFHNSKHVLDLKSYKETTIHASRNLRCNLRISSKTRRDMNIVETTTANVISDMNAAVNMETSWGKSLEILPQFTIK